MYAAVFDAKETKKMTPNLHIITVVKNAKADLERTRDSILTQTSNNWKWIVIDGASTDDTLACTKKLNKNRNVIVASDSDSGLYDAMNKGLSFVEDGYLIFLNAGDFFSGPEVVEKIQAKLSKTNSDIIFCDWITQWPDGSKWVKRHKHPPSEYIEHSLPSSHQAIIFSKSMHKNFQYSLEFKVAADYACVASMMKSQVNYSTLSYPIIIADRSRKSQTIRNWQYLISECVDVQRYILKVRTGKIIKGVIKRLLVVLYWKLKILKSHIYYDAS